MAVFAPLSAHLFYRGRLDRAMVRAMVRAFVLTVGLTLAFVNPAVNPSARAQGVEQGSSGACAMAPSTQAIDAMIASQLRDLDARMRASDESCLLKSADPSAAAAALLGRA